MTARLMYECADQPGVWVVQRRADSFRPNEWPTGTSPAIEARPLGGRGFLFVAGAITCGPVTQFLFEQNIGVQVRADALFEVIV